MPRGRAVSGRDGLECLSDGIIASSGLPLKITWLVSVARSMWIFLLQRAHRASTTTQFVVERANLL